MKRFRRWIKRVLTCATLLVAMALGFAGYLYVGVVPRWEIKQLADGAVAVEYEEGQVHYTIVSEEPPSWVELNSVPEDAQWAFIVAEDWRFYRHPGFDIYEIRNALMEAWRNGTPPRGASTIPQQVAKNLFLTSEYSVWRKTKELSIALYMEHVLTKEQILEVYLNTIEYGEGLYGISAASTHYFGKNPDELKTEEAVFLAVLLPNPKQFETNLRDEGMSDAMRSRVDTILIVMRGLHYLSIEEYEQERDAGLVFRPGIAKTGD